MKIDLDKSGAEYLWIDREKNGQHLHRAKIGFDRIEIFEVDDEIVEIYVESLVHRQDPEPDETRRYLRTSPRLIADYQSYAPRLVEEMREYRSRIRNLGLDAQQV